MKSFSNHLNSTKEFGEKINILKKPVFRSSAVFPIVQNSSYSSRVLFLGYWLLKRNIKDVGLLITLRSSDGNLLLRDFRKIDDARSYVIELNELLKKINFTEEIFLGSLEIEIFSSEDMVFPYPALVLDYYNYDFNTCVHTLGRIYNDFEDLLENQQFFVPETGFDIYADKNLHAFLSFVNGPLKNESPKIIFEVYNYKSEKLTGTFNLKTINSFQTIFIKLEDYIPKLSNFLEGKSGSISIKHNFEGFFPRFLVGNIQDSTESLVFTHSYYDSKTLNSSEHYVKQESLLHYDCTVPIPIFSDNNLFTELVLYPNFSPCKFKLNLQIFNSSGNLILEKSNFLEIDSEQFELTKINFNDILTKFNLLKKNPSTAYLICEFNKKEIPSRIKFGLNVGRKFTNFKLPCNICFNANIANPNTDHKPGSFKWFPIFNIGKTVVILENFYPLKNYDKNANIILSFFRQSDNQSIKRILNIRPNGEFRLIVSDDEELKKFFNNELGWITAKSDTPYLQGYYFVFHDSGSVAGDHLF